MVLLDAPLGTYLGWNLTTSGFHKDQICNYLGGMIPFARSLQQRSAAGDQRLSLKSAPAAMKESAVLRQPASGRGARFTRR